MGDASLPRPWVHNLITRHSKKRDYFPPIFASVCRGALSLSSSCLFSLRVPGVSASKRADTHLAPSLNADPSLSSRTHQRDLPRYKLAAPVRRNQRFPSPHSLLFSLLFLFLGCLGQLLPQPLLPTFSLPNNPQSFTPPPPTPHVPPPTPLHPSSTSLH